MIRRLAIAAAVVIWLLVRRRQAVARRGLAAGASSRQPALPLLGLRSTEARRCAGELGAGAGLAALAGHVEERRRHGRGRDDGARAVRPTQRGASPRLARVAGSESITLG